LPVLTPPPGWIADPDVDGIVCPGPDCITPADRDSYLDRLDAADGAIAQVIAEDGGPAVRFDDLDDADEDDAWR
jgi:hypothetical protein